MSTPPQTILVNLTMAQEFVGVPHLLTVYWTLSVELVFYVLCTGLVLVRWPRRPVLLAWIALFALVAATLLLTLVWQRQVPTVRLALIATAFIGAVWFRLHQDTVSRRSWFTLLAAAAVLLPVAFWCKANLAHDAVPLDIAPLAMSVTWVTAFACVALLAQLPNQAVPRFAQWLGRISYALYLLHPIVLAGCARWIGNPVVWFAVATVASLVLAAVVHRAIERPFIRLGRDWRRSA